jgi:hypothetical protein
MMKKLGANAKAGSTNRAWTGERGEGAKTILKGISDNFSPI